MSSSVQCRPDAPTRVVPPRRGVEKIVREFSVPPLYEVGATGNLTDVIHSAAAETPHTALLGRKVDGAWQDIAAAAFLAAVTAVAKGLAAAAIQADERARIMFRIHCARALV